MSDGARKFSAYTEIRLAIFFEETGLKWVSSDNRDILTVRLTHNMSGDTFSDFTMKITLISAWITNHMHVKVWDAFTYPMLNFSGFPIIVK